jgi:carbon monoxide dehydrogenase subunit G
MTFDERFTTKAPPDVAFAYLADFSNLPDWDPSITSVQKVTPGPVGVGSRYRVSMAFLGLPVTLDYHVETHEPDKHAVLVGRATGTLATDTVNVTAHKSGSRVRWQAEIALAFPVSLFDPLLSWMFGSSVRAAVENLKRELDALVSPQAPPT